MTCIILQNPKTCFTTTIYTLQCHSALVFSETPAVHFIWDVFKTDNKPVNSPKLVCSSLSFWSFKSFLDYKKVKVKSPTASWFFTLWYSMASCVSSRILSTSSTDISCHHQEKTRRILNPKKSDVDGKCFVDILRTGILTQFVTV